MPCERCAGLPVACIECPEVVAAAREPRRGRPSTNRDAHAFGLVCAMTPSRRQRGAASVNADVLADAHAERAERTRTNRAAALAVNRRLKGKADVELRRRMLAEWLTGQHFSSASAALRWLRMEAARRTHNGTNPLPDSDRTIRGDLAALLKVGSIKSRKK